MTQEVKDTIKLIERPSRLDLAALPRDTQRCLGSLRQQLAATFNYTRQYPTKLEVLNEVLTATLKHVRTELAYQKQQADLAADIKHNMEQGAE